jgi:hypothetical protein
VATLSLGSQALMTLRPKAKYNLGPDSNNARGTKADVLKMVLRHGDLITMHGTGIQKLYEVCSLAYSMLKLANSQTACRDAKGEAPFCFNVSLCPSGDDGG